MANQTLFHVTHAKAGSTWLYNVFVSAFGSRRVAKRVGGKTENYHYEPGKIYPAMFLSFQDFSALEGSDSGPCFFVVRDIRDTLVSLYFSMRYSHTDKGFPHIAKFRQEVEGMSDPEGIAHTFRTRSAAFMRVQESWLDSGKPVMKYEELLSDAEGLLTGYFDSVGFSYDRAALKKAIDENSFEKKFGRALGQKDIKSHGRQGAPGDWKNYADPAVEAVIEERFGSLLAKCGYER
jgi:lipopolysaccharide transport system ATP-binding protein